MKFDVLIYFFFFFSWNEENLYVKYKDRSVYSPSLSMPGPPNHRVAMVSTALNPLPFKYVCMGNTLRLSRPLQLMTFLMKSVILVCSECLYVRLCI